MISILITIIMISILPIILQPYYWMLGISELICLSSYKAAVEKIRRQLSLVETLLVKQSFVCFMDVRRDSRSPDDHHHERKKKKKKKKEEREKEK